MKRPSMNPALVAVVLLPMLFAALALWSLGDRVDRLDALPAAVVNLDEPVQTGQGKDRQTVAAGRLLAAGLTEPAPAQDHPLSWQLTAPEDAAEGLREGDYHAVITIPESFSATVAGLTRNDPETARITVRSNDADGALVGAVSDQVGDVAAAELNQRITATFLEGIYARTGELKESLGRAEEGADRLADGAHRLGQGTVRLGDGAGALAGGLTTLSGGAARLADGAARLSTGSSRLAVGTGRLSDGADDLAGGADRLAGGLDVLHGRTRPLPGQARRLADGAGRIAGGVRGWSQVLLAWKQACRNDPVLLGSHARLCAATVQAVGADDGNAEAMVSGSQRLHDGADRLADGTPDLVGAIGRAANGADRVAAGSARLAQGGRKVDAGATRLAEGAARLGSGVGRLAAGAGAASDGAVRLADGSTRVVTGTERLGDGSRDLATGLGEGAERIPDLGPQAREKLAATVARPVVSDFDRLDATPSAAASLAPGVLALALWLGAFVTYLARRALPTKALAAATPASRAAFAGWLPAMAVGALQSLCVLAMLGLLDQVVVASWFGVVVYLPLAAAAFAAVNQAFVAVLGPGRGWLGAVAFTALQALTLEGLVPLDTAPALIEALGGVLPVPLAAAGLGAVMRAGEIDAVLGPATALALWGIAAFAVTTSAARRRRRLTLEDVRRRVMTSPG